MPAVTLITGDARCGKSERLFQAVLEAARTSSLHEIAVLLPTSFAVRTFLERLADEVGVLASPGVYTLHSLAARVLESAGRSPALAAPWQQLIAARSALAEAQASGRLEQLAHVASFSTAPRALLERCNEFARMGLSPDALRLAAERAARPHVAELALLYELYRKHLEAAGLALSSDILASAADLLQSRGAPELGFKRLFVDDFHDFTSDEKRFLLQLVDRADSALFTFRFQRDRPALYPATGRTLFLGADLPDYDEQALSLPSPDTEPQHWRLARRLFGPLPEAPEPARSVVLLEAATVADEVRLVVRQLARLKQETSAPWSDFALFYPAASVYEPLLQRALESASLPARLQAKRPFAAFALVRFLTSLCALAQGDFAPELLEPCFDLGWPFASSDLATELRARLKQSPAHLAPAALLQRFEKALEELDPSAFAVWRDFHRRLSALAEVSDYALVAEQLLAFLRSAGLALLRRRPASAERELGLLEPLRQLLQTPPLFESERELAPLALFAARLEAFGSTEATLSAPEGGLLCLPLDQARFTRPRFAFLLGLTEGVLPAALAPAPLLSETDKAALSPYLPVPFVDSDWFELRQVQLFYTAVTRPTERLFLSYPTRDEKGRPLLQSPFLSEVKRRLAFTPASPNYYLQQVGELLPPPEEAATARELLTSLLYALHRPWPLLASANRLASLERLYELVRSGPLARPLRDLLHAGAYSELRPLPPAARRVRLPELLASTTPSALDDFLQCPLRFYFQDVLRLRRPEPTGFFAARGLVLHFALAWLGRHVLKGKLPEELAGIEAEPLLEQALEAGLEGLGPELEDIPRAERLLLELFLRRTLRRFWTFHLERFPASRPAFFEFVFGASPEAEADPVSVRLPDSGLEFALRGRIDRLDYTPEGRLRLIDYKTSSPPSTGFEFESLKLNSLQLAVYALATRQLKAPFAEAAYLLLRSLDLKLEKTLTPEALASGLIERALAFLFEEMFQADYLPPAKPDDCKNCPYMSLCRRDRFKEALRFET